MLGPEPNLLWRTFSLELVKALRQIDPEIVLFLGAMLSDTPHSRPLPVGIYSTDPEVGKRYAMEPNDYTGPTGMIGVASQLLLHERIPSASLWVSVPHYVSTPPIRRPRRRCSPSSSRSCTSRSTTPRSRTRPRSGASP
ncbi:hypothetical protein G7085_20150 [Tessaracoccus sp. HDW20]|nr:hypothetical protein [Tessaracoccus coleopterorum]